MIEIPLTQGKFAKISDHQFERVSQYKWYAAWDGYGWRATTNIGETTMLLHRFILGLEPGDGIEVDHKNRDSLDCQDENLRIATRAQNVANRPKVHIGSSSKYKGVTWDKWSNKWMAQISIDGKHKNLGRFLDEEDAARAYDEAAWSAWGEFAVLNFPRKEVLTVD